MLAWLLNLAIGGSEAATPSPDCFTGFIGTLVDPDNDAIGFIGAISEQNGFSGSIDSTSLGLIGAMTGSNGYTGDLCND